MTGAGGVFDENVGDLLKSEKDDLFPLLIDSGMTDSEKQDFLLKISVEISRARIYFQLEQGSPTDAAKRLKKFSDSARRLHAAIDDMKADGGGQNQDPYQHMVIDFNTQVAIGNVTEPFPQKMWLETRNHHLDLSDILDTMQQDLIALALLSDATQKRITTNASPGDRIVDARARHVATKVMEIYRDMFNKMPPYNKASWFAQFMGRLGAILKINLGEKSLARTYKWVNPKAQ